jgi:DNA polymerase elongation subunit (family B)
MTESMEFPRKEAPVLDADTTNLEFQLMDWFVPESDKAAREMQKGMPYMPSDEKPAEYDIYMYGVTADGHSVCAHVEGFCPYFYVKPPPSWWGKMAGKVDALYNTLREGTTVNERTQRTGYIIPRRLLDHLVSVKKLMRKDFWGFTNGKDFPFIKITVKSLALFNILQRYFKTRAAEGFKLYESNIDPFLRFIHERDIRPCGWVRLNASCYDVLEGDDKFARTSYAVRVTYNDVHALDINKIAPLLIASFDLECTSSHGDFPVAKKNYRKLALDLVTAAKASPNKIDTEQAWNWILGAYKGNQETEEGVTIHQVYTKEKVLVKNVAKSLEPILETVTDHINNAAAAKKGKVASDDASDDEENEPRGVADTPTDNEMELNRMLSQYLPKLKGDPIIQIGTTVHIYGSDQIVYRHIGTLNSCDEIQNADVECFDTEEDLIRGWKDMMVRLDPDIITGYNIFGFDMDYLWKRAQELQVDDVLAEGFGRLNQRKTTLLEQKLSSSALGDNILRYIDVDGIVLIDMFKVMQRDHKLDSYKLDNVASVFLGDHKEDLKPKEIFEKYLGNSTDRRDIATYCLQDCALCNRLMHKLKVLENNVGMGNVCSVPLSYLFMRGQGVKIFSLVAKECRTKKYLIPVLRGFFDQFEEADGYEGAIVLDPKEGIYLDDPITVLDYSSLYPSSMIARNLSHDCFVNDSEFSAVEGIDYITVTYDVYEGVGDKKTCVGKKSCTFAQLPNGQKGIIPSILQQLLTQRKNTRKKIEYERFHMTDGSVITGLVKEVDDAHVEVCNVDNGEKVTLDLAKVDTREVAYSPFEQAVLDALQLAYKVTANSLYGQIGSRTSPIYWKDIAACTTATGREMIMTAKTFAEKEYGAEVVYGDTDSVFIKFPVKKVDENGNPLEKKVILQSAIAAGQKMAKEIKRLMPPPQSLEYEKTFYPFIIFSKKRYVGNLYEEDAYKKPKQKSMGIVLKRRDNAPIVKKVYGGIIDILMNKNDLHASVEFLKQQLQDLVDGKVPLEDLIITKTLRAEYKDPTKIAHKVLADRMGARDAGNKPMANDRIPFVYIRPPTGVEVKLQGDRIEHPDYIRETKITPDYRFYITNQLMTPISQLYALCVEQLPEYTYPPEYWEQMEIELMDKELYRDNEKKRKDRLTALRMKEVEALLFAPFTSQLEEVRKKPAARKVTSKQVTTTTLANPLTADITVVDNKKDKRYDCKVVVMDGDQVLDTIEDQIAKKRNSTTKQYCLRRMAEATFKKFHDNKDIKSRGLAFRIEDKTFLRTWKAAINKADEHRAALKAAIDSQDIGAFKALQEEFVFENLINMHDVVPYVIGSSK